MEKSYFFLIAALLVASGCVGNNSTTETSQETAEVYFNSIFEGNNDEAYELLSPSLRQDFGVEPFSEEIDMRRDGFGGQLEIENISSESSSEEVEILNVEFRRSYGERTSYRDTQVRVKKEGEKWFMDTPVNPYDRGTYEEDLVKCSGSTGFTGGDVIVDTVQVKDQVLKLDIQNGASNRIDIKNISIGESTEEIDDGDFGLGELRTLNFSNEVTSSQMCREFEMNVKYDNGVLTDQKVEGTIEGSFNIN